MWQCDRHGLQFSKQSWMSLTGGLEPERLLLGIYLPQLTVIQLHSDRARGASLGRGPGDERQLRSGPGFAHALRRALPVELMKSLPYEVVHLAEEEPAKDLEAMIQCWCNEVHA